MSTEFLDRLASQLKIGKDAAGRRAIERILDVIKEELRERDGDVIFSDSTRELGNSVKDACAIAKDVAGQKK